MGTRLTVVVLLLHLAACSGPSSRGLPGDPGTFEPPALRKNEGSDIGMQPIPYAPLLDAGRVYVQSIDPRSARALVTGLPGAAAEGVTQVCALNSRSGSSACFAAQEGPQGAGFSHVLTETLPGDLVSLWANGPAYAAGGPGLNSIEETVVRFSTPYPAAVRAVASLESADRRHDGLWIGDDGNGLFRLTPEGSFLRYTTADGLPSNFITGVVPDGPEALWLTANRDQGNSGRLLRLTWEEGSPRFETYDHTRFDLPSDGFHVLLSDNDGGLWIGSGNGVGRVKRTAAGLHFSSYAQWSAPGRPPLFLIRALADDGAGGVWAGGWGGLTHLRAAGGGYAFDVYGEAEGLPGNSVNAIEKDGARGFWVGTQGGLARLIPSAGGMQVVDYSGAHSLLAGPIGALLSDGSGGVRIGSSAYGLLHARFQDGAPSVTMLDRSGGLPSHDIRLIAPAGPDSVYIGTGADGLARIDRLHGSPVVRTFRDETGLLTNDIRRVVSDGEAGAWLHYAGRGVGHLRAEEGRNRPTVTNFTASRDLPPDGISAMGTDAAGGVWLAHPFSGLTRLRRSGSEYAVERFTAAHGIPPGVSTALRPDGAGAVWLGGENRIVRFAPSETPAVTVLGPSDGLPSHFSWRVKDLAVDRRGRLWAALSPVASATGPAVGSASRPPLIRLERGGGRIAVRTYSTADGLPGGSDLCENLVEAIAPDRENGVWIVSCGLTQIAEVGAEETFRTFSGPVWASLLVPDGPARFWAGHPLFGLKRITFADGVVHLSPFGLEQGLPGENVSGIDAHPLGGAWVALPGSGVALVTR